MSIFTSSALTGKLILVTGASSGLGRATAQLLSLCGARLIINGRNEERLAANLSSLDGNGHVCAPAILSDAEFVAAWVKDLSAAHGIIDGIFHAAGILQLKPVRLIRQRDILDTVSSSLMTGFGFAKAAASKGIVSDGSSILFMSSVVGSRGQPGMCTYSAAKSGIEGLVRSLSCELAPRKIRVNAIAAGSVETDMARNLRDLMGSENATQLEMHHLLGLGRTEDIANAALFLLSPASNWIKGTVMVVYGGYMVR